MLATDPELIEALRADLLTANYTESALRGELTEPVYQMWLQDNFTILPEGSRQQSGQAQLSELADLGLFLLAGHPLRTARVGELFPTLGLHGLTSLGLVAASEAEESEAETSAGTVRCRYQLWPQLLGATDYWILADRKTAPLPNDFVLGPNPAATTLLRYASTPQPRSTEPSAPQRDIWDLGSGSGVLGIALALDQRRSAPDQRVRILASDLSERACSLTAFNAALAQIEGVEVVRGDLLAPGENQQFDLIVSNPPFVLGPKDENQYTYRSAGMGPDGLLATLIAQSWQYLKPLGMVQMLVNWPVRAGQTEEQAWQSYQQDVALDTWLVHRDTTPVSNYIDLWLRDSGHFPGTAKYNEQYRNWWNFFAAENITDVAFGFVCMRRQATDVQLSEFHTVDKAPTTNHGLPWTHIFDTHDWVSTQSDLSYLRLRVSPDVQVATVTTYPETDIDSSLDAGGDISVETVRVTSNLGLCAPMQVEPIVASLIGACNGQLRLDQLYDAIAELTSQPLDLIEEYLDPIVRRLMVLQILEVAA